MKKLIAFLLAFVLSTTACACGAGGTASGSQASSGGQAAESTVPADNSVTEDSGSDPAAQSEIEAAEAGQKQEQTQNHEQSEEQKQENQGQEAAAEVTAAEDTAPEKTASPATAAGDTASEEAASPATAAGDTAPEEAASPATAAGDTAPEEAASQVTAAGGTAPEEAASAVTTSEEKAESTEASSDNRNAESDEYAELVAIGDVQVENGIMTVSITLPPEFAEGITQEQLDASNGTIYESAVLNEDGSVTYKMTRAQHKAVMEQLSDSFDESIQEMIDNNEYYSISAVTHNDDFTVFDVTLNGTELGFQDAYSAYAFYMYGGMYGIFNGHTPEHVIVNYRDPDGNLIEQGDSANMGDAEESPDTSDPSQDSESGTDNSANTGTFERTVLIDNDECSIVVKDINEKDFWGYTLKVELENKSPDKTFMFSVDDAYVNGVEADPLFATEVNAGKKANSEISFSSSELKKHGIDDFTDIEIMFRVYDTDTYEYVAAEETVHVYPHGEENAVMFSRETADTDTILADDDNVTIIVTGYTEKDEFGYYNVNLFFVNKTDTTVMFSVQDASVNGYMADPFFAIEIAPGKCAFRSMSWSDTVFEENGIEVVEEIVAHFVAYDSDNYERDYLDEEFTLNP